MTNELCVTGRRDLSPAACDAALRMIHSPDPKVIVRCTVDGEPVDRSELQADGTGMLFYRYCPIIPVSASLFQPEEGKFPGATPEAEIEFRRLT